MAKYVIRLTRKQFAKKSARKLLKRMLRAGGGVRVVFTR